MAGFGRGSVLFADTFVRADSATVGNGWIESEAVDGTWAISSNKMRGTNTSGASDNTVYHSINRAATGTLRYTMWFFTFNAGQTNRQVDFEFRAGSTRCVDIRIKANGKFAYVWYNGSTTAEVELSDTYSSSTDYKMIVIADSTDKKFWWYINGVLKVDNVTFRDTGSGAIDRVFINNGGTIDITACMVRTSSIRESF